MATKTCSHLDRIQPVTARTSGCEECLATGGQWVQLRMCLSCGHVGCCDSSPNKHATRHFQVSGHPVMRSAEPGDNWGWCYLDQAMLGPEQIAQSAGAEGSPPA